MADNYENGQSVVYGWHIGEYFGYSSEVCIYRGMTSLGDYILENPITNAVFLAKHIMAWEG